jgi:hypothetical protein
VSPDLRRTPRVDYVMVLPPRLATPESVPEWTFRWRGQRRAAVERNPVTYTLAFPAPDYGVSRPGCLSDHAEVSADLVLLSAADRAGFNPSEPHRLVYTVSRLIDVFGSDDTFGDDGTTDWYTNSFGIRFGGAMSTVAAGPGLPRVVAESGKVVTPDPHFWSITSTHLEMPGVADGFDTFLTLEDHDSGGDDEYDADPDPASRAIRLDIAPGPTPAKWMVAVRNGAGPVGTTFKLFQGTRAIYRVAGVGDVDVADVTHDLWLCPIDDSGRCVDE